jgi:hypothetical protein
MFFSAERVRLSNSKTAKKKSASSAFQKNPRHPRSKSIRVPPQKKVACEAHALQATF